MIKVQNLHRHFGGFHAVDGSSLEIAEGSITGLVGPNGAGKTTLFNVIAGVLPPTAGTVTMGGENITGMPPHALFHKGLLRTFQIAHEFGSMSVRENLMMVPGRNLEKFFGILGLDGSVLPMKKGHYLLRLMRF
jgi:branched-chain amino acid transport system ATP-binding protein